MFFDKYFIFCILTPTLSGFQVFNDPTVIIQNLPVPRSFKNWMTIQICRSWGMNFRKFSRPFFRLRNLQTCLTLNDLLTIKCSLKKLKLEKIPFSLSSFSETK